MWTRLVLAVVLMGSVAPAAFADQPCAADFQQQLNVSQRFADTLRFDKPGQMRVFAADGSEFTAGQAMWMQGRLRRASRLCARGGAADSAAAAAALTEVQGLIRAHHRGS